MIECPGIKGVEGEEYPVWPVKRGSGRCELLRQAEGMWPPSREAEILVSFAVSRVKGQRDPIQVVPRKVYFALKPYRGFRAFFVRMNGKTDTKGVYHAYEKGTAKDL